MGHRVLDNVEFIHPFDTALDMEASDYAAWAQGCYRDKSLLKFLDGKRPTLFVLRQLTHRQKLDRHNVPDGFARDEFTVRCGLVRVIDWDGEALPDMNRVSEGGLKDVIARKWMNDANLGEETIIGIAAGIYKISELSLPLPVRSVTPCGGSESQTAEPETSPASDT